MSSVRMCDNTGDRIQNGARWARIRKRAALGLLSAAVVGFVAPFAAGAADDLKLPASFRHWYHVNTMVIDKGSPLFEAMGGMHNVYINSTGEPALKRGKPYPDKDRIIGRLARIHHLRWLLRGRLTEGDRHHAEGQKEACLDGRLGLPGLGGR